MAGVPKGDPFSYGRYPVYRNIGTSGQGTGTGDIADEARPPGHVIGTLTNGGKRYTFSRPYAALLTRRLSRGDLTYQALYVVTHDKALQISTLRDCRSRELSDVRAPEVGVVVRVML